MSRFERFLVSAAAVMVVIYCFWQLSKEVIFSNIQLSRALAACEAKAAPPK